MVHFAFEKLYSQEKYQEQGFKEGVFAFPGKIPSPPKFNASTYQQFIGGLLRMWTIAGSNGRSRFNI
jgi:hypothetical protein